MIDDNFYLALSKSSKQRTASLTFGYKSFNCCHSANWKAGWQQSSDSTAEFTSGCPEKHCISTNFGNPSLFLQLCLPIFGGSTKLENHHQPYSILFYFITNISKHRNSRTLATLSSKPGSQARQPAGSRWLSLAQYLAPCC